jgi:hypothetical protein
MVRIAEFTDTKYVEQFAISPPVEVGEHIVDSLGRIAAIAVTGTDADPETIDELTQEVDRVGALLYESGGANALARYLTNVTMRRKMHTFFVSRLKIVH